ncbi:glycosyltransferase, partial [Streptomyces sp. NPDC048845]|uniref:glycosyltransferase family 2 protein n=1 Tax=Streptomyces sp. NPDC048845 TaxID=3155390 RepID=UPI003434F9D9
MTTGGPLPAPSLPSARRTRPVTVLSGTLVLTATAAWAAFHAVEAADYGNGASGRLAAVWMATFLLLALQTLLCHLERVPTPSPRTNRRLRALHVAVLMPVYNEDPGYLRLGLESFLRQTRPPDSVHVVDDGSTQTDYADVRAWWLTAAARAGIGTTWERVPNAGKRHAQARGVLRCPQAEIFVTVDSDSCLAPDAIEQILLPFHRPRVQSVAGLVLGTNHRASLLARITDLWFVTGQLVDRSSLSATGSVLVNSGPLAAYRADLVRDNLDSYLNETFLGRPVMFSDDSMLTLYAQMRGATVQQPGAIVFTAMPERPGHLLRMYLRWMRGSTIRSLWRLRYLSLARWAYWAHLMRWFQTVLSVSVLLWLLGVEPLVYGHTPPAALLFVPFLIGWAQGLRYLCVSRSDEPARSRILTWLMMPLAVLLAWTVLRALRWYGVATCARTGWGMRAVKEAGSMNPVVLLDEIDKVGSD